MNQSAAGQYIAKKRKGRNLTQEQLAEKLGVSNKTVSKWENGRCMPDYGVIQKLCAELGVSIPELMDGRDIAGSGAPAYDDALVLELIKRTQELEAQKNTMYGMLLIVMGIALLAISETFGGTNFEDLLSGILLGLAVGEMLAGAFFAGRGLIKK